MNLKMIAVAAGALCAAAGVSAQTVTVNAGGASATRATITNAVVNSICGAASGITVYRNGTNVTRVVCPSSLFAGATTLDFSYDNTTGSYLGVGPVAGNPGQTTARINLATCSGSGTEAIGGKTVAVRSCTGNEAVRVRPAIGNSDVEPQLFVDANLPAGATQPVPGGIGDVRGQFGISFGIVVSQALYTALQADQGLTVGSTLEAQRPSLSRAQVASLSTGNGGPLNNDWTALFTGTPPAAASNAVRWVRRVSGSGSQATFNANLLGYACSPRGFEPAAAQNTGTYIVEEHGSTGNQLAAVGSTTEFRAGFASRENAETANWKFVKLDGVFPTKANVQNGKYNWFTEQVLTLRSGATANETTLFEALATATGSPSIINGFTAAVREGVVALPGIADSSDPFYDTHRTRFRTLGNNCAVPFAVE